MMGDGGPWAGKISMIGSAPDWSTVLKILATGGEPPGDRNRPGITGGTELQAQLRTIRLGTPR